MMECSMVWVVAIVLWIKTHGKKITMKMGLAMRATTVLKKRTRTNFPVLSQAM